VYCQGAEFFHNVRIVKLIEPQKILHPIGLLLTFLFSSFIFFPTAVLSANQDIFEEFNEARVAILWDHKTIGKSYNDQASFASAFRSVNIQVDTLNTKNLADLQEYNLLVIPNYSAQRLSNYDRVIQFVENGGNLILDGQSRLAESLGFVFQWSYVRVTHMLDRFYPDDTLRLAITDTLVRFEQNEHDEVFCRDAITGEPIVVGRQYGKGKIIYLGLLFDPNSTGGYTRFPFLIDYVRDFFHLRPILKREFLEMYFDPGYRHNDDVDTLVQRWWNSGVRIIHAASWHQHPTWTYNYARLIVACHAKGMLVYAWLEPPHVSEKFWKQYPAWQEVNYRGEPIPPQWRHLVALTDSACLMKVKEEYSNLLRAYSWDGVNLAELYFESERGPRNPNLYSPMHSSARMEFKKNYGFDPAALFNMKSQFYWKNNHKALNQFERYRTKTLGRLHGEFLKMIDEVKTEKNQFEVIVTAMDDIGSPEMRSYHGSDIRGLIKLQKTYHFTLQIEDPQSRWSNDPRRYTSIAQRYRKLVGQRHQCMIDLNVLPFRDTKKSNPFPTKIQTGIECYQMVRSAALGSQRFSIYSESSVRSNDLRMLPYAASAPAKIHRVPNGWNVKSPFPVVIELPERYTSLITANGERLISKQGKFELPEGEYTLLITE